MRVSDEELEKIISGEDHPVRWEEVLALDLLDLRKAAREFFAEEDKWRSSENICSLDSEESRNVIKAHRHLRDLVVEWK